VGLPSVIIVAEMQVVMLSRWVANKVSMLLISAVEDAYALTMQVSDSVVRAAVRGEQLASIATKSIWYATEETPISCHSYSCHSLPVRWVYVIPTIEPQPATSPAC
jgi:hypothetical protein